jgi:hypothetical protein
MEAESNMKYLLRCLPSLMICGFAAALALSTPSARTADLKVSAKTEIRALQRQRKLLADRLNRLEAENHHVVPRGGL